MQHSEIYPVDTARVKQQLQSGEYYTQARNWYDELYHRPLRERSFFVVVTVLCALTIFMSLVVYSSMFPLNPAVPYVIKVEKLTDDIPFIMPLRWETGEDINLSVVRFLLANYVETREHYQYDVTDLERRFARLRATTGEAEFKKYQEEVNPENPASPYTKYGRDTKRMVQVQRVDVMLEAQPPQAKIYFSSLLNKGLEKQSNQWLATIAFRFPPLKVDQETNKVLQWDEAQRNFVPMQNIAFEVVSYATQEIGNLPQ